MLRKNKDLTSAGGNISLRYEKKMLLFLFHFTPEVILKTSTNNNNIEKVSVRKSLACRTRGSWRANS